MLPEVTIPDGVPHNCSCHPHAPAPSDCSRHTMNLSVTGSSGCRLYPLLVHDPAVASRFSQWSPKDGFTESCSSMNMHSIAGFCIKWYCMHRFSWQVLADRMGSFAFHFDGEAFVWLHNVQDAFGPVRQAGTCHMAVLALPLCCFSNKEATAAAQWLLMGKRPPRPDWSGYTYASLQWITWQTISKLTFFSSFWRDKACVCGLLFHVYGWNSPAIKQQLNFKVPWFLDL